MSVTFTTTVFKDAQKNATGLPVPAEALAALGAGKRPKVIVRMGGYSYRTSVGAMGEQAMLPLSAEHRAAAGVAPGDTVEVTLEVDSEPRTFELPADLAAALAARPGASDAFARLAPSRQKEHVRQVEAAKTAETRERRIRAIVDGLET